MAMGVFMGGLSSKAQADPLDAKKMDEETLRATVRVRVTGKLSHADKIETLKSFKKEAVKAGFPKEIIKLVTNDTILDYEMYGHKRIMYLNDGMFISIHTYEDGNFAPPTIRLYAINPNVIAEPLPPLSNGINTVTKKPYFLPLKGIAPQLSDKEYFKTLLKIMNTNFGAFMPMYPLNEKKIAKNQYAGKLVDKPAAFFADNLPMLEKDMSETEIAIRRKLGFVLNGAAEIMKAGGEIADLSGSCTGWDVHTFRLGSIINDYVVYNGIHNPTGALPYARGTLMNRQAFFLMKFQENFHKLMQEHGVEPGTPVNKPGLTPDQQQFAALGNTLANYINNLYKAKFLGGNSPHEKNQKLKSLDFLIGPENTTPPKEIKRIKFNTGSSSAKTCSSNRR